MISPFFYLLPRRNLQNLSDVRHRDGKSNFLIAYRFYPIFRISSISLLWRCVFLKVGVRDWKEAETFQVGKDDDWLMMTSLDHYPKSTNGRVQLVSCNKLSRRIGWLSPVGFHRRYSPSTSTLNMNRLHPSSWYLQNSGPFWLQSNFIRV